ncbi:hypothetical protein ACI2KR_07605 [Pseudomonas luteola]
MSNAASVNLLSRILSGLEDVKHGVTVIEISPLIALINRILKDIDHGFDVSSKIECLERDLRFLGLIGKE